MGIVVPETCWASNKICNKNLCCIYLAFYFHILTTMQGQNHIKSLAYAYGYPPNQFPDCRVNKSPPAASIITHINRRFINWLKIDFDHVIFTTFNFFCNFTNSTCLLPAPFKRFPRFHEYYIVRWTASIVKLLSRNFQRPVPEHTHSVHKTSGKHLLNSPLPDTSQNHSQEMSCF